MLPQKQKIKKSLLIFIFFATIFMLFSNGHFGGDGLENYLTAESIVLDGDIYINDKPFEIPEMRHGVKGIQDSEGRFSTSYGLGLPILLVPLYCIGHLIAGFIPSINHAYITQFTVSLFNPLVTAFLAMVLFLFIEKLGFSKRTCFLTALCYSFCTMAAVYTRSGFSEPAIALFLLLALFSIYLHEKTGLMRYILYASVLIGYTLLIKKNSLIYIPMLLAYLFYRGLQLKNLKRQLLLWATGAIPAIFLLIICFFYFALMKTSITSGLSTPKGDVTFYGGSMIKGLFYFLLSPGKGYFLYNIPLLLAFIGAKDMLRREKRLSLLIIIFVISNLLFYAFIFRRGSLFSWGPRYLYPTIPFMCIFLAYYIENAKNLVKRLSISLVFVAGLLIQLPSMFISFSKYLFFIKEKMILHEYFINFMPELSPIIGSWHLLISAVRETIFGTSSFFTYSPDFWFLKPITISLQGYDVWDIWWVSVPSIYPRLIIAAIACSVILLLTTIISFLKIENLIRE